MSVDKVDADIEEKLIQAEAYGAKHYVDDKLLLARHVVAALEHELHRQSRQALRSGMGSLGS